VHKYEKGINRIAAGRLHRIAQALDVEVSYFFESVETEYNVHPNVQQPRLLELARNFVALPSRRHQEAICILARTPANAELTPETGTEVSPEGSWDSDCLGSNPARHLFAAADVVNEREEAEKGQQHDRIYFGFVLMVAFAKGFLATKIAGRVTSLGILLGLGVIVSAFVLTGING
jgi:transcriptional regulator with XRE-family HTH domain